MLNALEQFYLDLEEPNQSIMLALRQIISNYDPAISEHWKYKAPFFCFSGKIFCYLWKNKKTNEPYIGIWKGQVIDFPGLVSGDRKQMKILPIPIDKDIPIESIYAIFDELRLHYT